MCTRTGLRAGLPGRLAEPARPEENGRGNREQRPAAVILPSCAGHTTPILSICNARIQKYFSVRRERGFFFAKKKKKKKKERHHTDARSLTQSHSAERRVAALALGGAEARGRRVPVAFGSVPVAFR